MAYRAVLERWQADSRLYVCELPGCYFAASKLDTVIIGAHNAVRDYLRWAHAHHLTVTQNETVELSVVEEGHALIGDIGPFFSSDLIPPGETELETAIKVATAALQDLVALYTDATPRQRTYKHTPEELSAQDILYNVARTDLWYASRLKIGYKTPPHPALPEGGVQAVWFAADHVHERMREIFEIGRANKYETDFEEWSLTKLIRRRTAHLREHYPRMLLAVRQRMA